MTESSFLAQVEERLISLETEIGLLSRFNPRAFEQEARRLISAGREGNEPPPAFDYVGFLGEDESRKELEEIRVELVSWGPQPVAELLLERLNELELELELVRARGTSDVSSLSSRRFAYSEEERGQAQACAEHWLSETRSPSREDEEGPEEERLSLAFALACHPWVLRLGCEVREADIPSVAAITSDGLVVQRGYRATRRELWRICVHELGAHFEPRFRARCADPPFRIGTAGCSEDEEGRAVLLEERAGFLDDARKRELAARHWAAAAALQGREWRSVAHELAAQGCSWEQAVRVSLRAFRGGELRSGVLRGGLGREVIYLASYLRVKQSLSERPELEAWMERGRISIAGAARLSQSSKSTITGV